MSQIINQNKRKMKIHIKRCNLFLMHLRKITETKVVVIMVYTTNNYKVAFKAYASFLYSNFLLISYILFNNTT